MLIIRCLFAYLLHENNLYTNSIAYLYGDLDLKLYKLLFNDTKSKNRNRGFVYLKLFISFMKVNSFSLHCCKWRNKHQT